MKIELTCTENGHNKFYNIEMVPNGCIITYGAIGTNGIQILKESEIPEELLFSLVKEKTKKGYARKKESRTEPHDFVFIFEDTEEEYRFPVFAKEIPDNCEELMQTMMDLLENKYGLHDVCVDGDDFWGITTYEIKEQYKVKVVEEWKEFIELILNFECGPISISKQTVTSTPTPPSPPPHPTRQKKQQQPAFLSHFSFGDLFTEYYVDRC